jgi:hypothetical protein
MNFEEMDSLFQRLSDQEMEYSERVSFEEVMNRRKKKKRAFIWWRRSVAILAGLSLVAVSIYLVQPDSNSANSNSNNTYSAAEKGTRNSKNNRANYAASGESDAANASILSKNNTSNENTSADNVNNTQENASNSSKLVKSNASLSSNSLLSSNSTSQKNKLPASATKPNQPVAKRRQVRNILAESMAIREALIRPESERAQQFQELAENPSGTSSLNNSSLASNASDLRMEANSNATSNNKSSNPSENRNALGSKSSESELANRSLEAENHQFGQLLQTSPETSAIDQFGGITDASQNFGFAWSKYLLKSARMRFTPIDWDKTNWDIEGIEFDIPEQRIRNKFQKLPWFFEVSAIAASNNTINFDEDRPLSVLGTQYLAQYSASFLKEFNNATMWGLGVQYSEWVGNGQWRENEFVKVMKLDTQIRSITLPGRPKHYYTVIDTNYQTVNNSRTGLISYKIDKVAIPISYRFHVQFMKVPLQIGMHLAPGVTTVSEGTYFTETSFNSIDKKRHTTMDGKLFVGPMIPVTRNMTLVIQPSVMYQSFVTDKGQVNGKFFGGLGVSMIWKIK